QPLRHIVSASYLYPFKGIYFFLTHRDFYPLFSRRLIPLTITSIVVLGLLFTFTYLPQAAFLLIFHGPTAWVNAAFLVLGEAQVVIALLFEAFLVDETLVDVFDVRFLSYPPILIPRKSKSSAKSNFMFTFTQDTTPLSPPRSPVQSLGPPTTSCIYSPFSLTLLLQFIILLPLNLIPIIGTPAFLILTGAKAGPLHHYRYFKLLGLNKKERKAEIRRRRLRYTWFGSVALVLQLVPVLSMFFLLTTACGSALWVVDLEGRRRESERMGGEVRVGDHPDEIGDEEVPPPPYTDDPV
ncbi:hypothetical protein LSUB1_G004831, partial [Lachnellula subtilissima]